MSIFKISIKISLLFFMGLSFNFLVEMYKPSASAETINDTNPPVVISVETDKQTYEAGDNIEVTILTSDDNNIEWVDFSFFYGSAKTILLTGSTTATEKYDDGFFKSIVNIKIPERTPTTTYNFGTIVVSDGTNETFMGEPNRFFEQTINIVNENNEFLDTTGPKLVSLETDKTTYLAGEQVKVMIISEDETNVSNATVSLYNNEGNSDLFLYGDVSETTQLSDELFETTVYVDIPARVRPDGYYINDISLSDGLYETHFGRGGPQKFDVPINIENVPDVDTEGPILLSVQTDKTTYKPGETIVMSILAEDETGIDGSQVSFYDDDQDSPRNYLHGDSTDFVSLGNGKFKSKIYIQIPSDVDDTTFRLGSIELLESLYYTYFYDWRFDFDLSINVSSQQDLDIPDQAETEEPTEEPTPEQPDTEEPIEEQVPEQPDTEEPTKEQTPEQPTEEQAAKQLTLEEPEEEQESIEETASEQPDTENEEKITETQETEKNDTQSVIPPAVNPVLPKDEVISGVAAPDSIGTITLPDGTELTVETDLEGNWIADVPAKIQIEAGEILDVTFYDEESDTKSESSVTISAETTDNESSEEEEFLPDTGETQANTGLFAAVVAFLGGALLFVTGRRKASKK